MKLTLEAMVFAMSGNWWWYLVNGKGIIKAQSPAIYKTSNKALAAGRKFLKDIKTAEVVEE